MDAKTIVIKTNIGELLFTFPESVAHVHMFEAVKSVKQGVPLNWTRPYREAEIVSAGFVSSGGRCYGRSESLDVESRPELDTKLLQRGGV